MDSKASSCSRIIEVEVTKKRTYVSLLLYSKSNSILFTNWALLTINKTLIFFSLIFEMICR